MAHGNSKTREEIVVSSSGIKILVSSEDIVKAGAQSVVVREAPLFLKGGKDATLLCTTFDEYKKKRAKLKDKHKFLKRGNVYRTELEFSEHICQVFHIVMEKYEDGKKERWFENMEKAFLQMLRKAEKRKIVSVATSLLGSGRNNENAKEAINVIARAADCFPSRNLKKIVIVEENESVKTMIYQQCSSVFKSSSQSVAPTINKGVGAHIRRLFNKLWAANDRDKKEENTFFRKRSMSHDDLSRRVDLPKQESRRRIMKQKADNKHNTIALTDAKATLEDQIQNSFHSDEEVDYNLSTLKPLQQTVEDKRRPLTVEQDRSFAKSRKVPDNTAIHDTVTANGNPVKKIEKQSKSISYTSLSGKECNIMGNDTMLTIESAPVGNEGEVSDGHDVRPKLQKLLQVNMLSNQEDSSPRQEDKENKCSGLPQHSEEVICSAKDSSLQFSRSDIQSKISHFEKMANATNNLPLSKKTTKENAEPPKKSLKETSISRQEHAYTSIQESGQFAKTPGLAQSNVNEPSLIEKERSTEESNLYPIPIVNTLLQTGKLGLVKEHESVSSSELFGSGTGTSQEDATTLKIPAVTSDSCNQTLDQPLEEYSSDFRNLRSLLSQCTRNLTLKREDIVDTLLKLYKDDELVKATVTVHFEDEIDNRVSDLASEMFTAFWYEVMQRYWKGEAKKTGSMKQWEESYATQ